ncbi:guanitoxin biosynthesis L-enduracididine beta-hydroxylase GntD [Streptomyces tsukubensis]|uniref:Arginine beta-hydroxylase, Fe(II)/alpha-ketoglutarate-dependent n=1 Tax=Streptomyces tsukubensis TaxID=83656 RepID=A0A1V4A9G5_9ACTN|nr:guanitoxin biosynthesis L-enduracididine beta-hydroxylase GntD [Streptomyces tsukubensis]OON79709.1 arginine beta-hydroxylase, Fe(II)/alpha-ketoglutarate-dependent [Streptomyces tsukubensis]QFR95898.1 arginine beta-hydroxylase, Fe(II)/alpha-ketoglutarate-dependent [Streptomyces tsukubensis]
MYRITLTPQEAAQCRALVAELAERYPSVESQEFLDDAALHAHDLPKGLRAALSAFRLKEPAVACVVEGIPVDDGAIGPTPDHWKDRPVHSPTLREEMFFLLCGQLLGDPIAWATQQDGRIMHDVIPIKGHEVGQLGTGSSTPLEWHTEDAFHPYRADYVGLMCLRNPDAAETTYVGVDDLSLDPRTREVLAGAHFPLLPDDAHRSENRAEPRAGDPTAELRERSYARISRMLSRPEPVPVLFGDPSDPYLRVHPYYIAPIEDDEARQALELFSEKVETHMKEAILEPGQVIFIDNFKAIHGRRPFRARYDGKDRWLKRINVARDLRKSRDARPAPHERVIY